MPWEMLVDDVPAHVEAERRINDAAKAEGMARGDFTRRTTPAGDPPALDALLIAYPDLVHPADVGTSLEGRPIEAYASAPVNPASSRHCCSMVARMHEVDLHHGAHLHRRHTRHRLRSDARITGLLQLVDICVIPIVNPDGYYYAYVAGGRRWRRTGDNGGVRGVDLNRNWGVDWGGPRAPARTHATMSTSAPDRSRTRDGSHARLRAGPPGIVGHIDFHCYSQLILNRGIHRRGTA